MIELIPLEKIERSILVIRDQKVLLDSTLAELYGVPTKRLNEQIHRNPKRFPPDFMFQLTQEEYQVLRSQFATLETGRGRHRKYLPFVFTEQGVAMLSSVLNSERAIKVNVEIMRAFVRLRAMVSSHKVLAKRLGELEQKVGTHDSAIKSLFEAIYEMMNPPASEKRKIGFNAKI